MDDYQRYRFSLTCRTDDLAVLYRLRALCQWAEEWRKPQIGWGGTTERSWETSGHCATFRFTQASHRDKFVTAAAELLAGRWEKIGESDEDPASRQRAPH
jgi:hypothetical protein